MVPGRVCSVAGVPQHLPSRSTGHSFQYAVQELASIGSYRTTRSAARTLYASMASHSTWVPNGHRTVGRAWKCWLGSCR